MLYSLSLEYCMLTLEKTLGHGSQDTLRTSHHRIGQSAVRHLEVSYDGGVV